MFCRPTVLLFSAFEIFRPLLNSKHSVCLELATGLRFIVRTHHMRTINQRVIHIHEMLTTVDASSSQTIGTWSNTVRFCRSLLPLPNNSTASENSINSMSSPGSIVNNLRWLHCCRSVAEAFYSHLILALFAVPLPKLYWQQWYPVNRTRQGPIFDCFRRTGKTPSGLSSAMDNRRQWILMFPISFYILPRDLTSSTVRNIPPKTEYVSSNQSVKLSIVSGVDSLNSNLYLYLVSRKECNQKISLPNKDILINTIEESKKTISLPYK